MNRGETLKSAAVLTFLDMHGSMRRNLCFICTVMVIAIMPGQVWAWGRIGHHVIAITAEDHLTPQARAAVAALLGPGVRLADVATWADEQREVPGSAPWHSVNVPISESRYDPRYCSPRGCVVSKIEDFKRVLLDRAAGKPEKAQALKFLIHLIGDLHQPLHVGDNNTRGGNLIQVRFLNKGSNLHRVWDYQIMELHTENEQVWLWDITFLANPKMVVEWSKGSPEDWATESLDLAKAAYRFPGSQVLIKSGAMLDSKYCASALPTIQRQLAKASIRTAWTLNQIFK
jgi:nuclease S1